VTKPGRYIGGEEQQRVKPADGLICRFVLAFPDLYEVGMSHLGTRILYNLINQRTTSRASGRSARGSTSRPSCGRAGLPLVSLESLHAAARVRRRRASACSTS
jgi:hypothetical protein